MKTSTVVLFVCVTLLLLLNISTAYEYEVEDLSYDDSVDTFANPPRDPNTLQYSYDYGSSSMFAKLSAASYCITHNANSVNKWSCQMCRNSGLSLSDVSAHHVQSSGIGVFIGYSQSYNRIIVAFRGSANFANWIANLDFGKTPYPCNGCQVHKGFLKVYQSVRPTVVSKIQQLQKAHPNAAVSITGHSLGGAIAKLAILDFNNGIFKITKVGGLLHVESSEVGMNMGIDPLPFNHDELSLLGAEQLTVRFNLAKPLYTFGAPRVGNPQFATYFRAAVGADSLFRLTHRQDPVPKLPAISMGFAHSTTEVYFPNAGVDTSHRVCSTSNGDDPSCIHKTGIIFSITDHSEYGGIIMTQSPGQC